MKPRSLRQLKLPLGITRITAAEARKMLGLRTAPQRKRSKYGNVRTQSRDGYWFDSTREAARYEALKLLELGGVISDLRLQVSYPLLVNGVKVAEYVADFDYVCNGEHVTEDCKGFRTKIYRRSKKHFEAQYGRRILET